MNRPGFPLGALLLASLVACVDTPPTLESLTWPDNIASVDGAASLPPRGPSVLLFLASDCPIAGRYAPTVQALGRDFPQFSWHAVYDAATHTTEQAQQHLDDFDLDLQPLLDPGSLRRITGARRTPTAVVLRPEGDAADFELLYRGRIDDRYESFGQRRPRPVTHDLADALGKALEGRAVPQPWPEPVGCSIDDSAS